MTVSVTVSVDERKYISRMDLHKITAETLRMARENEIRVNKERKALRKEDIKAKKRKEDIKNLGFQDVSFYPDVKKEEQSSLLKPAKRNEIKERFWKS